MSSSPTMIRLLSSCVACAHRAGQICRDVMQSGKLGIVDKGGNDPQTEADRKAQRCIVNTLANRFPDMTIYGEETLEPSEEDQLLVVKEYDAEILKESCPQEFLDLKTEDVIVWVDPLDGTAEFTEGFMDHVTVLIGISVKGEPVGGVIHKPFSTSAEGVDGGHTYWGLKGLGTRGVKTTPTQPPRTPSELSVAITRSHFTDLIQKTVSALNPREVLRVGGCGHKTMLVVEGKVDAYVFPSNGTKKWDTCAGDAIIRATGGLLTDVNGKLLDYDSWERYRNSMGLVVTMCKETHQAVLDGIPQEVKDALASKA